MTLKEKIAEKLWEQENEGSWETWEELYPIQRSEYLDRAEDIISIMSSHFGIK